MVSSIWDSGTVLYERALDVRSAVHETIASNLANEETPGYKQRILPFRETLAALQRGETPLDMSQSNARHLSLFNPQTHIFHHVNIVHSGGGLDGNTVNLEQEMTNMAENTMMYMAVSQFLKGRFDGWRTAIAEGRG
ncbi:MAG: flagellar basal body rod protein FlgB [Nitrospirales bacterium]|nr:flagellar basal body rod protein FlgB [Nitrospira sp.]MDR4502269.1 flagellar basal body rod protein FlgB [Nitrospirales bacterium]